jgi:hypothetical protein
MDCASCLYFLEGAPASAEEDPSVREHRSPDGQGICRRYPPRWSPDLEHSNTTSVFPYIHRDHFCGEYNAGVPIC